MVVWAVTSAALVVILGWMGLTLVISEHLGRSQAGWREMVPRLVLGLVAAASSLWWCALVLDVADAVSGFIAVSLERHPRRPAEGSPRNVPHRRLRRGASAWRSSWPCSISSTASSSST